ncbi:hypothetical protein [Flavobacterium commune]|uniref:DUF4136 domain-containing protein n=1 Tax=Flavobacterium commune TaxID=1306519 RepID=A0A1D9P5X0_9FLAO|nr:hypothetical protein [Flavobacterium commune]AOZ98016.1 hypothetical protein BIW12_00380 [Flavobacterium commune]
MIKNVLFFLLFLIILFSSSSCSRGIYQKEIVTQTTGIDFSNGKWLLGNIDVDYDVKDKLTRKVVKDFSKYLNNRLVNSINESSLLIANNVPLNPSKSMILDLKKGTGYDYFINIKYFNEKKHSLNSIAGKYVDRFTVDKYYYTKDWNHYIVQLEVYDLNLAQIIYSQRVRGALGDNTGITTSKPIKGIVIGCYQMIMKDIDKKSRN